MTLEEAIIHCEEVAEENESKANRIEQLHLTGNAEGCRECANEHRQLAEWLRELKSYREAEKYKWNNHQVACLLADIFGDTCACNYNRIDEWLPFKCELLDVCPNTVGVACWEQYLKHREVNADE